MIPDEVSKHQAVPHATMGRQRRCWSGCGFTRCATHDGFEMTRTLIGTSGWHYDSWRGPFFPEGLPLKQQLHYYANQFDSTELNGVFYRTPTPESVKAWREQTGKDFVFAWKASKFITHWKRLSDACENSLDLLEDRAKFLRGKLGPILFQLPPQFEANADRLLRSSSCYRRGVATASNFVIPAGYQPRILRVLADNNASLCLSDHHDAPAPWERTADFVYVRGHGPGGRYHGHYTRPALAQWPGASDPGNGKVVTSMSISTTTRKAQPPRMRPS